MKISVTQKIRKFLNNGYRKQSIKYLERFNCIM